MTGPEEPQQEEYDGPATLLVDGRELAARARLSGHFEPITGRYQWAGRLDPDDDLRAVLRSNTDVGLRTDSGGTAEATVREEDPWGGFRVSGTGHPPFAIPAEPV